MSELRYEAPLAAFDMDEWDDLCDVTTSSLISDTNSYNDNSPLVTSSNQNDNYQGSYKGHNEDRDFDDESFSGSLEDLVNSFDEKITKSLKSYVSRIQNRNTTQNTSDIDNNIKNTQPWRQSTSFTTKPLEITRCWDTLAFNGNITNTESNTQNDNNFNSEDYDFIDSSPTEEEIKCDINDSDNEVIVDDDDDDDDDSSISDMDEYGVGKESNHNDNHDDDADDDNDDVQYVSDTDTHENISDNSDEEIDDDEEALLINNDSRRTGGEVRALTSSVSAELRQYAQRVLDQECSEEEEQNALRKLSVRALWELKAELEACIVEHSERLVQELATRDDLEYEKEIKNEFIWLLLTVHRRRKEAAVTQFSKDEITKKTRCPSKKDLNGNQYMTTVIPYQSSSGPPTLERIRVFIKLLSAINDNNSQLPSLLSDYILKALCPAT